MKRIAIACPGRGSYTERSLGSLPAGHPWVRRAEELRAEYGLSSLLELDRAKRLSQKEHLRPANASPLIFLVTLLDAAEARERGRCVCVVGNSLGWYVALAVAEALSFDDGFRLVQEMSLLQEEVTGGGQILYPIVDDDWRVDATRVELVRAALEGAPDEAFPSIALGGYAVLAGTDAGIRHLKRALPAVQLAKNRYPFQLIGHGPYHTSLCAGVAERASGRLARLDWQRPRVALVDGRGVIFSPWSTDLDALREYTLHTQVVTPYDFTLSVRVALREFAADQIVLPGPGNSLGGVTGQILAREGWRGVHSKADFEALQGGDRPPVLSMRR